VGSVDFHRSRKLFFFTPQRKLETPQRKLEIPQRKLETPQTLGLKTLTAKFSDCENVWKKPLPSQGVLKANEPWPLINL